MSVPGSHRWTLWSLAAILLLAAGLRIWGCFGQGYPRCYYGDEYTNIERALRYGAQGSPDPGGWFNKPALGFYVLVIEYGAYYGVGCVTGKWENAYEFGVSYFQDQGPFLLIGRLSTALFGVLTVLLAYRLGKSLFDRRAGLLAALVLAVTLGHVASSQQVKMDVPAAFWNTWCTLLLVSIMRRGRYRDYVWAGLLAGLGMATKYYSLIMLMPIGLAHLLREPSALARSPRMFLSARLFTAPLALFVGFFIGSPYNTLDGWWTGKFLKLVRWSLERVGITLGEAAPRGPLVTSEHSIWDSFGILLGNLGSASGAGPVIAGLAALGCVVCLIRRSRNEILLLGTAVIMLAGIALANRQLPLPRHLNILYPVVAILAAVGVTGIGSRLPRGVRGVFAGAAALTVLLPFTPFPLGETIEENRRRNVIDPRNRVLAWMAENIPDGSVIINDHERAALMPDRFRCEWVIHRLEVLKGRSRRAIERAEALADDDPKKSRELEWHGNRIAKLEDQLTKWRFIARASDGYSGPRYDSIVLLHAWQTEDLRERPYATGDYNPTWPRSPWGERLDQIVYEMRREGRLVDREAVLAEYREWLTSAYRRIGADMGADLARSKGEPIRTLDELEWYAAQVLVPLWKEMGGRWPDPDPAASTPGSLVLPSIVELWRRDSPVSRPWLTWEERGSKAVHRPVRFFISTKKSYENYTPDKEKKRRNFFDWADLYDDLDANYDSWDFNLEDEDEARVIRIWDLRRRRPGAGKRTRVW